MPKTRATGAPSRGCGVDGTGGVAGNHEVIATRQPLEMSGDALAFVDPRGFMSRAPRPEATGGDPAGVDVRRVAMTNQDDATHRLIGAG